MKKIIIHRSLIRGTQSLILIFSLLAFSISNAEVVVAFIPTQGVEMKSSPWYQWFDERILPVFPDRIVFHEVEDLNALNELMNNFSMVDFAVLPENHYKEFLYLSDTIGSVDVGGGFLLFARPGVDKKTLDHFERIIAGGKNNPASESLEKGASPHNNRENVNFVTRLYREILGREPDRDGFNYWVGRLNSGELTCSQVAGHIKASEEAKNRQ